MSGVVPSRRLATYITLFDEAILWSQSRGLSGDWSRLRERLDAMTQRVRDDADIARASPDWAYRLEHSLLIEVLREALLPTVLDDLVATLHSQRARGESDPGVWRALDRSRFEEERRRHSRRAASAEAAVLTSLRRHAAKPSHLRILEGLRSIEVLYDARMGLEPAFDAELLVSEGRQLVEALCTLLPPMARRLLSWPVENSFRSELEGKPIDQLEPPHPFWHHKWPGLGVWYPVWVELRLGDDLPDPVGAWFIADVQEIYERWHSKAEAERRKELKKEQRKRHAAAAEERRQKRKAVTHQAEQRPLREEEELRSREQDRGQQVQQEEAQERFRQPSGVGRTWMDSLFEEWCERQGLSPKAVTGQSRARFNRMISGDLTGTDKN